MTPVETAPSACVVTAFARPNWLRLAEVATRRSGRSNQGPSATAKASSQPGVFGSVEPVHRRAYRIAFVHTAASNESTLTEWAPAPEPNLRDQLWAIDPLAPESQDDVLAVRAVRAAHILAELGPRRDRAVDSYLRAELAAHRPPVWTASLVVALDEFDDPAGEEPAWIEALMTAARDMDADPHRGLWENATLSAIQQLGRLCRGEAADGLLEFLSSAGLRVRQATLQALANVYSRDPAPASERVEKRLAELAYKLLDPDILMTADVIAFAANAFTAAAAASNPLVGPVVDRLVASRRPALLRLVVANLARLGRSRPDLQRLSLALTALVG